MQGQDLTPCISSTFLHIVQHRRGSVFNWFSSVEQTGSADSSFAEQVCTRANIRAFLCMQLGMPAEGDLFDNGWWWQ